MRRICTIAKELYLKIKKYVYILDEMQCVILQNLTYLLSDTLYKVLS